MLCISWVLEHFSISCKVLLVSVCPFVHKDGKEEMREGNFGHPWNMHNHCAFSGHLHTVLCIGFLLKCCFDWSQPECSLPSEKQVYIFSKMINYSMLFFDVMMVIKIKSILLHPFICIAVQKQRNTQQAREFKNNLTWKKQGILPFGCWSLSTAVLLQYKNLHWEGELSISRWCTPLFECWPSCLSACCCF